MKLLVHICCAPCLAYPLSVMREEGVEPDGVFYNPNIHPVDEFNRRMNALKQFASLKNLKVLYFDDYMQPEWENFKGTDADRCKMCYSTRLEKTARLAAAGGYGAFTTTLLVSPYQKHELIRQLGEKYANLHGVRFYYRDFRQGFRQGQREAANLGLYRQKYCGCIISMPPTRTDK